MKDIKNIFDSLQIPAASGDFEDKIIAAATARKKPAFYANYAAAACLLFIVAGFGLYTAQKPTATQGDYASIIDVIDEDDIYDDLI